VRVLSYFYQPTGFRLISDDWKLVASLEEELAAKHSNLEILAD
jgi:hypothetical protein